MLTITEEQFTEAMEAVVAAKGADYVYESPLGGNCMYLDRSREPSCLIAHALYHIDPELMYELGYYEGTSAEVVFDWMEDNEVLSVPPHVAVAAGEAQSVQDRQGTWGEALREYRTWVDGT